MAAPSVPDSERREPMTSEPWPPAFETILRSHLSLLDPGTPLDRDLSLADYGLDSLATVSLLLELEDEFSAMIPDELLVATTFTTPSALWGILADLVNA